MKKQDLFFWLCDNCKSEWWPKDAPDNPDDWIRPWRIKYEGDVEALRIAARLQGEGYSLQEICDELNNRDIKTQTGKTWNTPNLCVYLTKRGISSQGGDRTRIEGIVKTMAKKGYYGKDIAARLNSEGLLSYRGRNGTSSGVFHLSKKIGVKLKGKQGIHLKSDGGVHPWVNDETARIEKNRAWRRSYDMPRL